jgi:hypothetical protein
MCLYVCCGQTSRTLVIQTAEDELKLMYQTYNLKLKRMEMVYEGE